MLEPKLASTKPSSDSDGPGTVVASSDDPSSVVGVSSKELRNVADASGGTSDARVSKSNARVKSFFNNDAKWLDPIDHVNKMKTARSTYS